jgi:hypothetical protein
MTRQSSQSTSQLRAVSRNKSRTSEITVATDPLAKLEADLAALEEMKKQLLQQKKDAMRAKVNFRRYDSADPAIAGELEPRILPERTYESVSDQLHADILRVIRQLKMVRASDLMRELGLTRSNANFHMQKMAAEGKLYLMNEPDRGQTRYVATLDLDVLKSLIDQQYGGPSTPVRRSERPAQLVAANQRS